VTAIDLVLNGKNNPMALPPIARQDVQNAAAISPAVHKNAADQFSRAAQKTRTEVTASAVSRDGTNTAIKAEQPKVQGRGEREQGDHSHQGKHTRMMGDVRVTVGPDGQVTGRVNVGGNNDANATAGSQNTGVDRPILRQANGQQKDSELLRTPGLALPTLGNTVFALPRSTDNHTSRPRETSSRGSGKFSADSGNAATATVLNAETGLQGHQDSDGSSGGGNQQGSGGDKSNNNNGGNQGGINDENTDGKFGPNLRGGETAQPEIHNYDTQQQATERTEVPRALRDAIKREGTAMGFDPVTSLQYASSNAAVRHAIQQFKRENPGAQIDALDINCLNNIASMLPADGATSETMLSFLRQLMENSNKLENSFSREKWRPSDRLKILSATQNLLAGQDPANRNADTLLEIANALTAPPATPSKLQEITQRLGQSEFSNPTMGYPPAIDPLSGATQGFGTNEQVRDSELRSMMQYFLDEIPGVHFTIESMEAVFRLVKMLTDSDAASETMLSMLLKLRANTTDEMLWLSPDVFPSLISTAEQILGTLAPGERTPQALLDLIEALTARPSSKTDLTESDKSKLKAQLEHLKSQMDFAAEFTSMIS
jgi:hypothetical protein